jgi:diguanylate cyclase (GGDEF)-like protein
MPQSDRERTRPRHQIIGKKSTGVVLLSTTLAVLITGGVSLWDTYGLLRDRIGDVHPVVLARNREAVTAWTRHTRDEITRIAHADGIRSWRAHGNATRDESADRILGAALSAAQPFAALLLLDVEGQVRATAGSGADLATLEDALAEHSAVESDLDEVMAAASLRRLMSAVKAPETRMIQLGTGAPLPVVSTALAGGRGSLHGLLQRDEIAARLRTGLLGEMGSVHLKDTEGRVIASASYAGDAAASLSPASLQAEHPPHVQTFWSLEQSWVVSSSLPVGDLGWTLVVQQEAASAFAPLLWQLPRVLVPGVLVIFVCTLLASRISSSADDRIHDLALAFRRVAQGDLELELPADRASGDLGTVLRGFNSMVSQLRSSHRETQTSLRALQEQNQAFQKRHDTLARLSVTDGLTELNNHRFFQDQLRLELKRMARTGEGLSMLIIDIDDFKKLNDRYGHAAGDEFLKQLARILKESVRDTDLLARYGGEEFVIITPGTELEGAVVLAEKLRTSVAETSFIVDDTMRPRRMTVSIGVAQYNRSRTELFTAADAALYRAKAAGKDCVVRAEREA